jgi:hypothetical protein
MKKKIKPKLKKYSDGGKNPNTLEGDLYSKIIMNRNKDKDFVQRAYAVGQYPESNMFQQFDPSEFGQKNSHLMSWGEDDNGQAYIWPSIFNDKNEAIPVPNQYADYISSIGYKNVTGIPTRQNGGSIKEFDNGGRQSILGTPQQYQAYQDSMFIHNDGERMRNLLINPSTTESVYANQVSRYYTGNAINQNNPTNQAISRLNTLNGEFPAVESTQRRTFPSGYTAYASLFKKPVQPIILDRLKEPTFELNQEQKYLPQSEQHLDFDPIGLKKGTYFTRPRQQQEAGQGSVDYFDNKTGKLLKTKEFGGNITTENEWEIVNEDLPKAGNGLSLVKTLTPIGNRVRTNKPSLYKNVVNNVDKIEHNINDKYRVQADDFTDKFYPTDYDEDSGHNDYVDALRHSATAMYTTSGQGKFLSPLKIPYTNVMGLAHELKGLVNYVNEPGNLTWQGAKQQLKETGSDLYNNFVGSVIGGLPTNIENKEKILKFAKDKNILSDLSKKQNGGKLPKRKLNLKKSNSDWEIIG